MQSKDMIRAVEVDPNRGTTERYRTPRPARPARKIGTCCPLCVEWDSDEKPHSSGYVKLTLDGKLYEPGANSSTVWRCACSAGNSLAAKNHGDSRQTPSTWSRVDQLTYSGFLGFIDVRKSRLLAEGVIFPDSEP